MYRYLATFFFLFALTAGIPAQNIPLEIQGETVTVVKKLPFTVLAPTGHDVYFWDVPSNVKWSTSGEAGNSILVTEAPAGEVTVRVKFIKIDWANKKLGQRFGTTTFIVGTAPVPPPPTPDPPKPDPDNPAPINAPGYRVLMVYKKLDYQPTQSEALFGAEARAFLNANCTPGADGKTKAYRIFPSGTDASADEPWVRDTVQRHPGKDSYLVVSNGKTGYDGDLPATSADIMAILKKYLPK